MNVSNEDPAAVPVKVGERVKVVSGPLAGIEGVVVQKQDQKRLFVELRAIHQVVSIDVHTNYLQSV